MFLIQKNRFINTVIPFKLQPRSDTHSRLRPYSGKYDRHDRILSYFYGMPVSVLRSYFSVSFTER